MTLRAIIAFLTFAVGISTSALWVVRSQQTTQHVVVPPNVARAPDTNTNVVKTDAAMLEMVFVLDTTGSMGGLIEGAKQRIWGIVNEVMQSPSRPSVRVGLVAYRDRGDSYVTQVTPLTDDLDKIYATLMEFRAEGGGDGPEDVRTALADGVGRAGWTEQTKNGAYVSQILFLVGDAPPHDDYTDVPDTLETTKKAIEQGMIVNTIQCGELGDTRQVWQTIAQRGEGQYFAIAQDGGVQAIASPYDEKLSELGAKLGSTFTAYGGGSGLAGVELRAGLAAKQMRMESAVVTSAPKSAAADRAVNKALNSVAYAHDLMQSLENGSVKIDAIKEDDLPDDLRKLTVAARKKEIEKRLEERKKLRADIVSLSKQRDEYIAAERKKLTGGKQQQGFDAAVASALKAQMARKRLK